MARPLRIEFPGALHHVTCRGNRRERIFRDRADRLAWLDKVDVVCHRYHFVIHAFCLMSNHFHLLAETPEGNLGQGMRQLNSAYSQAFNRRHGLVGHVLQGRYNAILVQKDSYLNELSRYIVLNPVRAGIVTGPGDWEWSSYRSIMGAVPAPHWLDMKFLLASFGRDLTAARQAYAAFVLAGVGAESPLKKVRFQSLLGNATFIAKHRRPLQEPLSRDIAREQRRALVMSLDEYVATFPQREKAMAAAYHSTAFSMAAIAAHFGVSVKTVSRAVAADERARSGTTASDG